MQVLVVAHLLRKPIDSFLEALTRWRSKSQAPRSPA